MTFSLKIPSYAEILLLQMLMDISDDCSGESNYTFTSLNWIIGQ